MFSNLNIAWPMRDLTAQAKVATGQGVGPDSYATGGEAVTLSEIGLSEVWYWPAIIASNGAATLLAWYNPTTTALMWFDMAGAEVANGTDLSDYTYTFFITGK